MVRETKIPAEGKKCGLLRPELLRACLWGVYLSGVLLGAGCGGEEISFLTEQFLEMRRLREWRSVFLTSLASSAGMLSLLYVSGLCAVGQPAAVVSLLARGMGLGGCIGTLYRQQGFFGGFCAAVLLVLPEAAAAFCFVRGGGSAVRMSCRLFGAVLDPEPVSLSGGFRRYSIRFVILFVLLFLSAVLSGLLSGLFGSLLR